MHKFLSLIGIKLAASASFVSLSLVLCPTYLALADAAPVNNAARTSETSVQLSSRLNEMVDALLAFKRDPAVPGSPSPAIISDFKVVKSAALNLVINVNGLAQSPVAPTLERMNSVFNAYNNLIVVMGLTDPRQLDYFPNLKELGQELGTLRSSLPKQ